jgi:hypothetical protein
MVSREVKAMHKLSRTMLACGTFATLVSAQSVVAPGAAVALQDAAAGAAATESANRYLVHVTGMT